MLNARMLAICALGIACSTQALQGQSLTRYRNFELRSGVASVSALAGVQPSTAKAIHQRPALLQELEWRPSRWVSGSTVASTDSVERIFFSFYNDQLFRIVVDYGGGQTAGMTGPDMIQAISAVYGAPLPRTPAPTRALSRIDIESGSAISRWGNSEHAVVLYQTTSYNSSYRLVMTDIRLDDLARKAAAQAVQLDDQEAPAREIARQKKEQEDGRAAAEKARAANKEAFRP
jgi:hypothetical protein